MFRWDKETGCDLVCRRKPPMETRAADVFNFRPKLRRWKEKKICYWHEYSWKFFQIFLGIFFLPSVFFFGLKNNEAKSTWQIKEKIFKIKHWLIRDLQTQNSRLQIYHRVVLLKLKIVRHPTSRTISDQSINYIKKILIGN